MAKPIKDKAKELKEIRKYCGEHSCSECNYKELCGKVPGQWKDEEIERVAAG